MMKRKKGESPEEFSHRTGRRGAKVGAKAGGKARAQALSPERRREIARKAADARWERARGKVWGGPTDEVK